MGEISSLDHRMTTACFESAGWRTFSAAGFSRRHLRRVPTFQQPVKPILDVPDVCQYNWHL